MPELGSAGDIPGVTALSLDGKGGASPVGPAAAVAAPPGASIWIHIDFSDPQAADWAWESSGLEDSIVSAMLDPESRPRTLQQGDGVLTMLRGVNLNPGARLEDMISVRTWLEPGRVVTASRRRLRSLTEIREAVERGDGPTSPARLVVDLVERLNHYIGEAIEQIEEKIDRAEDEATRDTSLNRSSSFNRLRRQTAQIRRYLSPQREALDRLARVTDALFQSSEMIELREQLNGTHDYEGAEKIELSELLALKKEKREENTAYFRDTGQLKRELLDTIIEYKAVQQREKLINEVAQPRK